MAQPSPSAYSPSFDIRGRDGFLERKIKSMASGIRWGVLVVLIMICGGIYLGKDYARIIVQGPRKLTVTELMKLSKEELAKSPWVTVSGLELEAKMIKPKKRSNTADSTVALNSYEEGDPLLFVVVNGATLPDTVTGVVGEMATDFRNKLGASQLGKLLRSSKQGSITIECRWEEIYLLPGLAIAFCVGALIWAIVRWTMASNLLNPVKSQPLRDLARFGPLHEVLPVMNSDLGSSMAKTLKPFTVGMNYISMAAGRVLNVFQFNKIVWSYLEVTQHSYNGIPTGKTYKVFLCDDFGHRAFIAASKKRSEEILEIIKQRNSNVLIGFSPELQEAWNKDAQSTIRLIKERPRTTEGASNQ